MNKHAESVLKNPANKLIAVDMDGTLCEGKFWEEVTTPNPEIIEFVNDLYKRWAHIIIWTARQREYYVATAKWLDDHWVMYHGISMRVKIGADLYIDDKCVNVEDLFDK